MSKRRSKNVKVPYVAKSDRQGKTAGADVSVAPQDAGLPEIPSVDEIPVEENSATLASSEVSESERAEVEDSRPEPELHDSLQAAGGDSPPLDEAPGGAVAEEPVAEEPVAEEPVVEVHAADEAPASDAMPPEETGDSAEPAISESMEPAQAHDPLQEFEDASAALAQAIPIEQGDVRAISAIESIALPDVSELDLEMGGDVAQAWDSRPVNEAEPSGEESSQPQADEVAAAAGSGGKGRKKLKLNKLQKHLRSAPEVEEPAPEPEPEPAPVIRHQPSEPRIAAFAKLTQYQSLSLAHVPGLPEETDVPGHWRGVGFGIGGRRLVSAFDEVVEIMRLPQITHVPGTQPWMLGVANVRGTLLPVVDLKQFLEGERTVMHEGQRVLVVRQAGGNVAVLIDQLFGQRSFNDSQKSDLKSTSGTRYDYFIKQFYRVGDNDWGVFSMSMLTRTPEFRQAAA